MAARRLQVPHGMTSSNVKCQDCGESSAAIEWGFVLLARHGWSAQLGDTGDEPRWRCPSCNRSLAAAEAAFESEPPRRRLRVLLVDDQAMVLKASASMLRELDVVTASSGAEALARLAEGAHFDVVVSDVTMPGITGPELFAQIRELYPQLAERMLLVSGDSHGANLACQALARRHHITTMPRILDKPVPRDELVRAIKELGQPRLPRSGTFALDDTLPAMRAKAK
jgi:CheY-like chemotaxis protein